MFLPQSLLVKCFACILTTKQRSNSEESITYRVLQDYSLEHCYAILSKYGSISCTFRTAVLDMISRFYSSHQKFLDTRKHFSAINLLFQHIQPCSISLLTGIYSDIPVDFDIVTRLKLDLSEVADVQDFDDYFDDIDFPEVTHFYCNRVFANLFFECYINSFPKLKCLTLEKCSPMEDNFIFPAFMKNLESLDISDLSSKKDDPLEILFDVSNLIDLKILKIKCEQGFNLVGLNCLLFLQQLLLIYVKNFDSLNPNIRLKNFHLRPSSPECLLNYNFSPVIFQHCEICFDPNGMLPSSEFFNFLLTNSKKISFCSSKTQDWQSGIKFSIKNSKKVSDLLIEPGNLFGSVQANLDLSSSTQLERLEIFCCNIQQFSTDPVLYIRKLVLMKFDFKLFLSLIEKCPYLTFLHCNSMTGTSQWDVDYVIPQMNYLEFLQFDMDNYFYQQLPTLPKLKTLCVARVGDFTFCGFHCNFPALINLKLMKINVFDYLEEPNYSVQNFTLISCHFKSSKFLLPFEKLNTLLIDDHHVQPQKKKKKLLFPKNLKNLYLETLFCNFKHWKVSSSNLSFISGNLYVDEETSERQECEDSIVQFKSSFPNVFVSVNVVSDEIDEFYQMAELLFDFSRR
ncbi:hypothetical protein RCL1_003856 [Eukaryota sp. TZLM3-RCL]